jgi:hypothetical protein
MACDYARTFALREEPLEGCGRQGRCTPWCSRISHEASTSRLG